MASSDHLTGANLPKIQHCVLIDGDFGRHELFTNIHPYILNHIGRLNDGFLFKMYTTLALQLMSNTSNIHYHICYHFSSVEIDEYYKVLQLFYPQNVWLHRLVNTASDKNNDTVDCAAKFDEIISNYKYSSIWIIHGIENQYRNLIERLNCIDRPKVTIFSYSWLENLRDGSNRIEYLIHNKMLTSTQYRAEESGTQPDRSKSTSVTTQCAEQQRSPKISIKCNIAGCKKQCKDDKALQAHMLAKHKSIISNQTQHPIHDKMTRVVEHQSEECSTQSDSPEPAPVTTEYAEQKEIPNVQIKCDVDGCKKQFKNEFTLNIHKLAKHSSNNPDLTEHLSHDKTKCEIEHRSEELSSQSDGAELASVTTEDTEQQETLKVYIECDIEGCNQIFKSIQALKDHQSTEHIVPQPDTNEEAKTSRRRRKKSQITCGFDDCKLSIKTTELEKHQVEMHAIPLRCLFSVACMNSGEKYLGRRDLINHIVMQHTDLSTKKTCIFAECRNQKRNYDWFGLLQHMIEKHARYLLQDIMPKLVEKDLAKSKLIDANSVSAESMMEVPSWDLNGPYRCSYQDCSEFYWEEKPLRHHEAFEHPVPFTCPYTSQCQKSKRKYIGLLNLRRHIISIHAPLFSEPSCFYSGCQKEGNKPFKSWPAVVRHIILQHLEADGICVEATTSTAGKRVKSKKCAYNNCDLFFNSRENFHNHLITCHPYSLRCPYSSQCNKIDSAENYLGLMNLEEHIKTDHPEQYRASMCFDNTCQEKKHFSNWISLIDHIVRKHWIDIKSN